MCLVVRAEKEGIRYYVHMSTGNYNAVTGKLYTDFGYLTSDSFIGKDISDLFNALTGYSRKDHYIKLLVAPRLSGTRFWSVSDVRSTCMKSMETDI